MRENEYQTFSKLKWSKTQNLGHNRISIIHNYNVFKYAKI
jgi:hypothetical protein